ncbi:DEAD/DEAH box helicase [Marivirga lumbricoides]|uniref:DEAD/DEAH box helicase n=1 Tax=Marivirga lumbricoides TaxID=1046115 RepID=A0ABQ1N4M5_9BACT|nr:DEAD/DEAH box helicase [Marivirga lumbricoides]
MSTFDNFNLSKPLKQAINDLAFDAPTAIQEKAFPAILSGKDVIGIAQTGTGKTFAYMLPILHQLKFSKQLTPRVLILVPTRELVMQVEENIKSYTKYMSVRVLGIYGEANIRLQMEAIAEGLDILVATPGRLYDLVIKRALSLKDIHKLVIDEVDVMLDLGFRPQLTNILDLLPARRQNIMFSATMTAEVDDFVNDFFVFSERIAVAPSGTPLENIEQISFKVKNFLTKVNLLTHLLTDKLEYQKVLVFISNKKLADRLFDALEEAFGASVAVIHANKSQNYRIRSVQEFDSGEKRILVASDVISRGLDLEKVSHVINFDTPAFPENYMHRIGRTGRAAQKGKSILFYTEKEEAAKEAIESLMSFQIPVRNFPEGVDVVNELIPEEREETVDKSFFRNDKKKESGPSHHEKLEKNKKVNLGGSYKRKLAAKHKKPQTKGAKSSTKRGRKG